MINCKQIGNSYRYLGDQNEKQISWRNDRYGHHASLTNLHKFNQAVHVQRSLQVTSSGDPTGAHLPHQRGAYPGPPKSQLLQAQCLFEKAALLKQSQLNPMAPKDESLIYESPFFSKKQQAIEGSQFQFGGKGHPKATKYKRMKAIFTKGSVENHHGNNNSISMLGRDQGLYSPDQQQRACDHTMSMIMGYDEAYSHSPMPKQKGNPNPSEERTEDLTFDLSKKSPFSQKQQHGRLHPAKVGQKTARNGRNTHKFMESEAQITYDQSSQMNKP